MGFFKDAFNILTNKYSDYTASFTPKNKFSDVKEYVKSKEFFGYSMSKQPLKDVDQGAYWIYQYDCSGNKHADNASRFTVKIEHYGEYIKSMVVEFHDYNPKDNLEKAIKKMESSLPQYEPEQTTTVSAPDPNADYSAMSLSAVLNAMDKTLKEFATDPIMELFVTIKNMRAAIDDKMDLATRGKCANAFSKLDMYISTLNTQFSNPALAANLGQFVDNYVSQMRAAVCEIAANVQ